MIVRNVAVGKWMELGWHAQSNLFSVREKVVTAQPLPASPGLNRFEPPADSPAGKLGFQPISFEQTGPQPNAERRRLDALRRHPLTPKEN